MITLILLSPLICFDEN